MFYTICKIKILTFYVCKIPILQKIKNYILGIDELETAISAQHINLMLEEEQNSLERKTNLDYKTRHQW